MLAVGFQPRRHAFFGGGTGRTRGWERAEVLVLQERETRRIRAYTARKVGLRRGVASLGRTAITRAAVEHRNKRLQLVGIHCVSAILPVLSTEGTDGQVQLHDVVIHTIAAEHFHSAILENIPGGSKPGSQLVT